MTNAGYNTVELRGPAEPTDLEKLNIGDVIYINGMIYTGREGVYRKILDEGNSPPV
ncbi:MAG: fumarate hydratase, partial [Gammaproteobacteria bacterium]|nr:fumarate hydratase [Gammaproteobacteria bacterium]